MERFDQRQGFLTSALVHSVIIMALASQPQFFARKAQETPSPETPEVSRRVFMPPPEVLRQLAPRPVPPPRPQPRQPAPEPVPTPVPPPARNDRIRVGPQLDTGERKVLNLADIATDAPKGLPNAPPRTVAPGNDPNSRAAERRAIQEEIEGRPGTTLRDGDGSQARGDGGARRVVEGSIGESLRNLEGRLAQNSQLGLPSGTAQRLGGLIFDPQGADFTAWLRHADSEFQRNWIPPQPLLMGFRGHVDLRFVVARNGSVTQLEVVKTSGIPALDRAVANLVRGANFLPLPSDYRPDQIVFQFTVTFEDPRQS